MRYLTHKFIPFLLVITSVCIGTSYELVLTGNTGVSVEHILISLGLILLLTKCSTVSQGQQIALITVVTLSTLAIIQTNLTFSSLHLISFFILASQYYIYKFCDLKFLKKMIQLSILLIIIQAMFFKNQGVEWETWDYVYLPGYGDINRLSILGFVSNSLAIMCIPFFIFLIDKENSSKYIFLLLLILISLMLLTFSRIGWILLYIVFLIKFPKRTLILTLFLLMILLIFIDLAPYTDAIQNVITRGGVLNNSRINIWMENLESLRGIDFFFGKGIMLKPSDNSIVSIIYGGGISMVILFLILLLSLNNLKFIYRGELAILIFVFFLSTLTFDVFSQRKIIFSFALVGAYYSVKRQNFNN